MSSAACSQARRTVLSPTSLRAYLAAQLDGRDLVIPGCSRADGYSALLLAGGEKLAPPAPRASSRRPGHPRR